MAPVTAKVLRERLDKLADMSHPYLTLDDGAHFLDVSRERMRAMVQRNQVEGGGPPDAEHWYVYKTSVQSRLVVRLEILIEDGSDNE